MQRCFDPFTREVESVHIKRCDPETKRQPVYLGERLIGEVGPEDLRAHGASPWTAVSLLSSERVHGRRTVRGFRGQREAIDYLLDVLWQEDDRDAFKIEWPLTNRRERRHGR